MLPEHGPGPENTNKESYLRIGGKNIKTHNFLQNTI